MNEIKLTVNQDRPLTLQNFLMGKKGVSRRLLTRLKRTNSGIMRNGQLVRSIDMVYPGDEIILKISDDSFLEPNGSLIAEVAFENENLIIFDKPPNMPVHPSARHRTDTLGNYFAYLFPELTFRPINRLDSNTSGLCIIAKNTLSAGLLQGCRHKVYYAAVHGITPESGTIDAPIARLGKSIITRCVREDGQRAVTHFERICCNERYSLEKIRLETGRTHQIRVHFSHIGCPLAGDDLYGGSREHITRQALHCGEITFNEPLTGKEITVTSQLPEDITKLFSQNQF